MFEFSGDLWQVAVRTVIVYVVLVIGLRLFGKRQIGQMTAFDLVVLLLISNAVQNAMTGPNTTVWGGLIAAVTLLLVNFLVVLLVRYIPGLRSMLRGEPTILVSQGKVIQHNLSQEEVDLDEILMAAREHGLSELSEVELAMLEIDGSISIIPYSDHHIRVKRPLRFLRHR
jgi:uncharacterized membrane protein YcaP (DUF421 family)